MLPIVTITKPSLSCWFVRNKTVGEFVYNTGKQAHIVDIHQYLFQLIQNFLTHIGQIVFHAQIKAAYFADFISNSLVNWKELV